jgi:hypothetical protein
MKNKKDKKQKNSLIEFAKKELKRAGFFDKDSDYDGLLAQATMDVIKVFSKQGHSGSSAPIVVNLFKKLALFEPITPIMGTEDEWVACTDNVYQNNRCSALFKEGKDGAPYYLDAIVWQGEESYDTFTGQVDKYRSRQYIKEFPFIPKTFYVNVIKEVLPDDWTEEPFIEGNETYDMKEYEETGVKNWKKNNYRYKIKDENQMKEVFEYYKESQ